jgi:hypothetical protein
MVQQIEEEISAVWKVLLSFASRFGNDWVLLL